MLRRLTLIALLSSSPAWADVVELQSDAPSVRMLSVDGLINNKLNTDLARALKQKPKLRTAIYFTSPGGVLERNQALVDILVNFAKTSYRLHHQTTLFVVHQECSSACTVFLASLRRFMNPEHLELIVAENTELYFHAPRVHVNGRFTPYKQWEEFHRVAGILYGAYLNTGVNPQWLVEHKDVFSQPEAEIMYTAKQLCEGHSNILSRVDCQPLDGLFVKVEEVLVTGQRFRE